MASARGNSALVGRLIGLAMLVAAIAAVVFVDWNPKPEVVAQPIRPLKIMRIGTSFAGATRKYPGTVRANQEVNLAFQVSGALISLEVRDGLEVKAGDVLAQLDPSDFESEVQSKQAVLEKAREDFEKVERLFKEGSAGNQELVDYKSAFQVAQAEARVAEKALSDTTLVAPFSGVVAQVMVDNFENIIAKRPVLSLQDVSSVEIVVSVPEERVMRATRGTEKDKYRFVATFDYLASREFDVTIKEFSTDADPTTQTYTATFVMPAPTDVTILPGMTVTIHEYPRDPPPSDQTTYAVPLDAVPVDETTGDYFVWRVNESKDGKATVSRQPVEVGNMVGDDILVVDGLATGDQIALAGVHILQPDQVVKPFTDDSNASANRP